MMKESTWADRWTTMKMMSNSRWTMMTRKRTRWMMEAYKVAASKS